MTPESLIPLVDHATRQPDRWLFLASLVLGVLSVVWLVRWLVGSYAKTVAKLTEVITTNTDALREVRDVVRNCPRK